MFFNKNDNDVKFILKKNWNDQIENNSSFLSDSKYLGYINKTNKEEYFCTYNSFRRTYNSLDWLVIGKTMFSKKNKSSSFYKLRTGDLIKFGK